MKERVIFLSLFLLLLLLPSAQPAKANVKGLLIIEKDGKRIISDPLNINYLRWIEYLYGGTPTLAGDISGGNAYSITHSDNNNPLLSRKESYILLGTGTTAFSINDKTLTSYVTTPPSLVRIVTSGNAINITITGTYIATSTININEVGYAISHKTSGGGPYYYLLIRDVLSNTLTVATGQKLNITFVVMLNQ